MSVTIVIPTIGRPTLQRAIDSIENQTIKTKYIIQKDLGHWGAATTRNFGMSRVLTLWVGFCDDDDYLDPNYNKWFIEESAGNDMVIFRMKNSPVDSIPDHQDVDKLEFNKVGISFAVKTTLANKIQFKDMIGEDWAFIQAVKKAGYKIHISKHIAYFIGDLKE